MFSIFRNKKIQNVREEMVNFDEKPKLRKKPRKVKTLEEILLGQQERFVKQKENEEKKAAQAMFNNNNFNNQKGKKEWNKNQRNDNRVSNYYKPAPNIPAVVGVGAVVGTVGVADVVHSGYYKNQNEELYFNEAPPEVYPEPTYSSEWGIQDTHDSSGIHNEMDMFHYEQGSDYQMGYPVYQNDMESTPNIEENSNRDLDDGHQFDESYREPEVEYYNPNAISEQSDEMLLNFMQQVADDNTEVDDSNSDSY